MKSFNTAHVVLQPKYHTEDQQASVTLRATCSLLGSMWKTLKYPSSWHLPLSYPKIPTLPSLLVFTHEQPEWHWHLWVCPDRNRVRPLGLSLFNPPPPQPSLLHSWKYPTVLPSLQAPNIPSINKSDWLNCRHSERIVHTSIHSNRLLFRF